MGNHLNTAKSSYTLNNQKIEPMKSLLQKQVKPTAQKQKVCDPAMLIAERQPFQDILMESSGLYTQNIFLLYSKKPSNSSSQQARKLSATGTYRLHSRQTMEKQDNPS